MKGTFWAPLQDRNASSLILPSAINSYRPVMKALLSRWTAEFLLKEHTHQHVCMCVWGNGAGDSVLVKRARHRIRIPTPNPRSTKDLPPKQSISQIAVWEQQEMSLPIGNVLTVAKPVGTLGSNSFTTSRATIWLWPIAASLLDSSTDSRRSSLQ